jgi:hypothetical protein
MRNETGVQHPQDSESRKKVLSLRLKVVKNTGLKICSHTQISGVEPVCSTSFSLCFVLKNHRKTGVATQAKY